MAGPLQGGTSTPESTCRAGGPLPLLTEIQGIGAARKELGAAASDSGLLLAPNPPSGGWGGHTPLLRAVTLPCLPGVGPGYVQGRCSAPEGSVAQTGQPHPSQGAAGVSRGAGSGQRQREGQEPTPHPLCPPVLYSWVCLLSAWVQTPAHRAFLPLEAPLSHSAPLLHTLTHKPLIWCLIRFPSLIIAARSPFTFQ